MRTIGIVSDTHGTLPEEVLDLFRDAEAILHAGDIGGEEILRRLELVAPVTAVYGNTDVPPLRDRLALVARVEVAGIPAVVTHGHQYGSPTPGALVASHPDASLIAFGHTHRPETRERRGVLLVNPGSAGSPRSGRPASVALVTVDGETGPRAEIVELGGSG